MIRSIIVLNSYSLGRVKVRVAETMALLKQHGFDAQHLELDFSQPLPEPSARTLGEADLVLILGGDGSFIQAGKIVASVDVPLLGVNMGNLGFLAELEFPELTRALLDLQVGRFHYHRRMILEGQVFSANDDGTQSVLALNDIVIRCEEARLIETNLWIDTQFVYRCRGDGLIVATASGSTAYALSAQGPIIDNALDLIEVVPVSAHLSFRHPIVMPDDKQIRIEVPQHSAILLADGRSKIKLDAGAKVKIARAKHSLRVVQFDHSNYYSKLQSKLT